MTSAVVMCFPQFVIHTEALCGCGLALDRHCNLCRCDWRL